MSTENGCLFNLAVDPCEVTDVGDEFPELRAKLIERLEGYVASTPDALLTTMSTLKYSDYGPAGDFWGPFWAPRNAKNPGTPPEAPKKNPKVM